MQVQIGSPTDGQELLRLRPGGSVFDLSSERLMVSFPNHTVTFSGIPVTKGIRILLDLLKSNAYARNELAGRVSLLASLNEQFVSYLIELLQSNGCLYRIVGGEESDFELGSQGQFHASMGRDPKEALARLEELRVVVVTPSTAERSILRAIQDVGVTDIQPVSIVPGSHTKVILHQITDHLVDHSSPILIVWGFPYRMPFARCLNSLSLERNIRTLYGSCEGTVGRIGPYVIPRDSPCLECLIHRFLSNAGEFESEAYAQYNSEQEELSEPWPTHSLFQSAVARLLILELERIAINAAPTTIGAVVELDYRSGLSQRRPVLKVPRCPSCRLQISERYAWDAPLSTPINDNVQ